jgi:hypothetical protein
MSCGQGNGARGEMRARAAGGACGTGGPGGLGENWAVDSQHETAVEESFQLCTEGHHPK